MGVRRWLIGGLIVITCSASAADWPFFRGGDRTGVAEDKSVPTEWSAQKNIKWKVALPAGGNGSPVVWGDRVLVTCAEDPKGVGRSLYCFDRNDGKKLWAKTVKWEQADPTHAANPYCGSSPATDGKRVIVWHGSAGLFAYDMDGNDLWNRDLGEFKHIWGYGGSPVILGDKAIVNCGPGTSCFVVAVDVKSGEILWKTPEQETKAEAYAGSWTTPVVRKVDGKELLFISQSKQVKAYDPADGKVVWSCAGIGDLAYADCMISPELGIGVAMAGYGGKAMGFKLGGSGNVTDTNRLWQNTEKPPQRIGTGVFVGKNLFIPQENGFTCLDPFTGKFLWQQREPGVIWSSLALAGDRFYATSQKGVTFVFAADPMQYKLLAKNEVGEKSNSTLAISNGQIFLRTWGHLYCIGQ
jgi:outer membrane protein assembly factor BamB